MDQAIFLPRAIVMGTKVRLRKEAFKETRVREWRFSGIEKGKLVLFLPEGLILRVQLEDIDWEFQKRPKIED